MVIAAIQSALRSACCGITLSNGVEVMVSPETYRAIMDRYRTQDEPDASIRWDHAVLDILRPDRPNEWRFLVRSLGYHISGEAIGTRRRRQIVNR